MEWTVSIVDGGILFVNKAAVCVETKVLRDVEKAREHLKWKANVICSSKRNAQPDIVETNSQNRKQRFTNELCKAYTELCTARAE
ncbi:hypothetical protein T4E_12104 [Trichinella pseudospiralis]|uniref:Uncharacterized protein n=1 Tax=Trichinella pseudospiralis TaxID=6337 RepID=A0A0V0YGT8_TRIPS|nr:hypothetical protein T4E_12104 [Trichinella pseudospiralis]